MKRLSLPDNTRSLLAAQVNLNGTFNHTCRFKNINQPWSFALQVERAPTGALFTIITGTEKHSLTVYDTDQDTCRVLADFIECIANGCMDTAAPATRRERTESAERGQLLDGMQHEQLRQLVRNGGSLLLDIGFDEDVRVAVHRTLSRKGITAIIVAGDTCPRTQCFTAYGDEQHSVDRLLQSLNHLAASVVPAALAA